MNTARENTTKLHSVAISPKNKEKFEQIKIDNNQAIRKLAGKTGADYITGDDVFNYLYYCYNEYQVKLYVEQKQKQEEEETSQEADTHLQNQKETKEKQEIEENFLEKNLPPPINK